MKTHTATHRLKSLFRSLKMYMLRFLDRLGITYIKFLGMFGFPIFRVFGPDCLNPNSFSSLVSQTKNGDN